MNSVLRCGLRKYEMAIAPSAQTERPGMPTKADFLNPFCKRRADKGFAWRLSRTRLNNRHQLPSFSSTVSVGVPEDSEFTTIRSIRPSPLKSPAAIDVGLGPAA